ncbi:hypothetical protein CCAX7_27870 [Capsulimonas corticalis]|uniref:Uncharacterized protein n=1 Tax=Capsulimonas corticalis TaxID=2219043 RepID=A0A402CTH9_9BACT|nr:hypothetical protein [Capsulimonas corticalis]BDI30736.1 hypothetical protein CCAX7_27870 [Capsulimonas corticalis]
MSPHTVHTLISIVFLAILIGVPYIGGPILIKNKQTIARHPAQNRFDPATLDPQVAPFFYHAVQALVTCGFTVIDYVTKPNETQNVTPCVVYLVNRANGDMASIACFFVNINGEVKIQNNSIFFTTDYANGEVVSSCILPPNSAGSCYKYRPYVHSWRSFDDVDAPELYKRHRFLIQKYAPQSPVVAPETGREMEAFDRSNVDVHAYQVKKGLMWVDTARDVYAPTWFGAFYMTWALLWPCKQLRLAHSQMKARRELADYRRAI